MFRENISAAAGNINKIADHKGIMPLTPTVPRTANKTSRISIVTHIASRLPTCGAPFGPVASYTSIPTIQMKM